MFIAGTGKAGTTSLFYYLSAHPAICPATVKEPGFFFDVDYPAGRVCSFEDGPDNYERLFPAWEPGQIRLEATPEYLYSAGTAARIKATFPEAKLLFSLREPVSFFISMFRYAQQLGEIPNSTSLEEHVEKQQGTGPGAGSTPPPYLGMGRFSDYLAPYVAAFGRDRIKVVFFEDLVRDSRGVLQDIAEFAGVDPAFYNTYDFKTHNATVAVRFQGLNRALNTLRGVLNRMTYDHPRLHAAIRWTNNSLVQPVWISLNKLGGAKRKASVPESATQALKVFYAEEKEALERLLGISPPWPAADRKSGTTGGSS